MQPPYSFRFQEHRALFASLGVLALITVMVLSEALFKGILTGFYIGLAVAVVFATFLCLLRPRAILCAVLIYLASPVPILWNPSYSGALTGILLVNCIAGVLLTEGLEAFRPFKTRATLWLIIAMIAALVYAVVRGNRPGYMLGDFYQIFEFTSAFVLTRVLIRSEGQWRKVVNVLLGIVVATSLMHWQTRYKVPTTFRISTRLA